MGDALAAKEVDDAQEVLEAPVATEYGAGDPPSAMMEDSTHVETENAAGDVPPALETTSKNDATSAGLEEIVCVPEAPGLACECGFPMTAG